MIGQIDLHVMTDFIQLHLIFVVIGILTTEVFLLLQVITGLEELRF